MVNQEASSSAPLTVIRESKIPQKNKVSASDSSKYQKMKYNVWTDPALLTSNVMRFTLKPSMKHDLHRDDPLTSQLSTEKLQFKPQLTSLYMVSTPYKF